MLSDEAMDQVDLLKGLQKTRQQLSGGEVICLDWADGVSMLVMAFQKTKCERGEVYQGTKALQN